MVFHAVEHVIGNMNISVSPRPKTDTRFILTVKIGPACHKKPGLRGHLQKRGCLFRCVIAVISLDGAQSASNEFVHEKSKRGRPTSKPAGVGQRCDSAPPTDLIDSFQRGRKFALYSGQDRIRRSEEHTSELQSRSDLV